jgi:hypothetical protein
MRLVNLRLVRTPGIRMGFTLEPAAGINLVTGPNGIGKSSVCRAVLNLLWPGTHGEQPFSARAEFEQEGRKLVVTRQDLDSPQWSGPKPDLGPDHLATRYSLGMLELLKPADHDDPLVHEIRRQMAGGFDLAAIRTGLFQVETGRKEKSALLTADNLVAKLQADQRALATAQMRLTDLKKTRDLSAQARDRRHVLEMIRDLAGQMAAHQAATLDLQGLPPATESVRREDPDRLVLLRRLETELEERIAERTASLAATDRELDDLEDTCPVVGDLQLGLLKKNLENLTELRAALRQAEREAEDRHLAEILTTPPPRLPSWPFWTAAGAGSGFLAAGILLPFPQEIWSWVVFGIGVALGSLGVWGWLFRPRDAGQAALIEEKKRELARKKDLLQSSLRQWTAGLENFNATGAQADLPAVSNLEEAKQVLEDAEQNRSRLRELRSRQTVDGDLLERDRKELTERRAEIKALFERLALPDTRDSDPEVPRLLELKPAFAKAVRDRDQAAREMERLRQGIATSDFLLRSGEGPQMSPESLAELIAQERSLADDLGNLEKEIAHIETAIERAQEGHELQEAMAARQNARTALVEVRQSQREAALGNLLLERVARQHELESRPLVLEIADAFFQLFTGHRYELKVAAQGDGGDRFLALPEDSLQPRELDELSDGTRAQLLLAVKLAFITVGESGARPPLFLDDSLTSADPERFGAVAESLGRLADQEQRQIFYLTANPADAAAFQRALAGAHLPAACHLDLAEVRGLAGAAPLGLLDPANLPPRLVAPDPAGMTAAAYAETLRVPRPDPWAPRGGLHVWFLADDDLDLVRRLVNGNTPTLGRFRKGKAVLLAAGEITPAEAAAIAAQGELWDAWLDGWRIGRARAVTPHFLKNSSAVSRKFQEQVLALLEQCDGDGAELLGALADKKVKGFRLQKIATLRQELEDAELLDPREPLNSDELLNHIRERVAPLLATGVLDMKKVRTKALTYSRLVKNQKPSRLD